MKIRKGFTLIETALSLVIFSTMMIYVVNSIQNTNRELQVQKELEFYRVFERGTKNSFEQIIDAFSGICNNVSSDSQATWGWGHDQCSNTLLFPTFVSNDKIKYDLDLSSLSSSESTNLVNAIMHSFSPYCSLDKQTSTTLEMICPSVRGVDYDLGSGTIANPQTAGSDVDPLLPPDVMLTTAKNDQDGVERQHSYNFSFLDVYEKRRMISLQKFSKYKTMLKTFHNMKLSLEVANSPSTGLNSIDDEFVPWMWTVFGDDSSSVLGSLCDTSGGTSCTNLDTDDIWRSNLSGIALYSRRIIDNLNNGDLSITTDGFGNMLSFYPFMSQCSDADISSCSTTAPPLPQEDYYNQMRPPYASVLYIETYKNKTTSAPEYGRTYISY